MYRDLEKAEQERNLLEAKIKSTLNPNLSKPSKVSKNNFTDSTDINMKNVIVEFFHFIFSGKLIYDIEYRIEKIKATGEENLVFKLPLVYNNKFQEHYSQKYGSYPPPLPRFLEALAFLRKIAPAAALLKQKLFHNQNTLHSGHKPVSYKNCVTIPMPTVAEICPSLPPAAPKNIDK